MARERPLYSDVHVPLQSRPQQVAWGGGRPAAVGHEYRLSGKLSELSNDRECEGPKHCYPVERDEGCPLRSKRCLRWTERPLTTTEYDLGHR